MRVPERGEGGASPGASSPRGLRIDRASQGGRLRPRRLEGGSSARSREAHGEEREEQQREASFLVKVLKAPPARPLLPSMREAQSSCEVGHVSDEWMAEAPSMLEAGGAVGGWGRLESAGQCRRLLSPAEPLQPRTRPPPPHHRPRHSPVTSRGSRRSAGGAHPSSPACRHRSSACRRRGSACRRRSSACRRRSSACRRRSSACHRRSSACRRGARSSEQVGGRV